MNIVLVLLSRCYTDHKCEEKEVGFHHSGLALRPARLVLRPSGERTVLWQVLYVLYRNSLKLMFHNGVPDSSAMKWGRLVN